MTDTITPQTRVAYTAERELRFGVVLYGGVSLAIYIHGVTKELMSMVRATAPEKPARPWERVMGTSRGAAMLSNGELKGAERVYRKLGQMLHLHGLEPEPAPDAPIRTRFVVDVLAGTSAGGINAIFLAKALSENGSIDSLADLWVNEGDLAKLVNDGKSVDPDVKSLPVQMPPRSLLDSRKMYAKLLRALSEVSASAKATQGEKSPLVDELDLFVTATDVQGLPLPIQLFDRLVYERKHRALFAFRHAPFDPEPRRMDFARDNDPFLAFAARCTSAFPFAFEPMRLADIDDVVKSGPFGSGVYSGSATREWRKFYADYLRPRPGEPVPSEDSRAERFLRTAFGDGGYLDNKPFTRAISAIRSRTASVPVDRKLLYVEPAPEHPENDPVAPVTPDVLQNAIKALIELPRYETIREDLDEVRAFNRLIDRLGIVRSGRDLDVQIGLGAHPQLLSSREWRNADLGAMIKIYGLGYGAYHRLKVTGVTDEITRLLAHLFELDETSDDFRAVRYLIGAWRNKRFTLYAARPGAPGKTENEFLYRYDVWWRIRRLRHTVNITDEAASLVVGPKRFQERFAPVLSELDITFADGRNEEAVLAIKAGLAEAQQVLLDGVRSLYEKALTEKSPFQTIAGKLSRATLRECIEGRSDEERRKIASRLAEDYLAEFDAVAAMIERELTRAHKTAGAIARILLYGRQEYRRKDQSLIPARMHELFDVVDEANIGVPRRVIAHYYERFEEYDQLTYPLIFARETGETDSIEVVRISPEDATVLFDERKRNQFSDDKNHTRTPALGAHPKLAGTAFSNFGAFLAKDWRRNDMLWGRLDGAERLIRAALADRGIPGLENQLILEAQEAILEEELGTDSLRAVIQTLGEDYSTALRNADGWLKHFDADVRAPKIHAILMRCIDKSHRGEFFVAVSQSNRDPPARQTVATLARATDVIARILGDLSDQARFPVGARWAAMVARFGRVVWRLVQVSVPRTLPNLIARHFMGLLYLFEAFMIVGGILFGADEVARFGWLALAATLALQTLLVVFGTGSWTRGTRLVRGIGILIAGALMGLGVVYVVNHASTDVERVWVRVLDFVGLRDSEP